MPRYPNSVPAPLATAINNAAHTYQVPVDLLVGIWRIESGSTYPNPTVNPEGYGGLFGTTLWNGSTAAQANKAAEILRTQIVFHGGSISQGLLAYSGGGYSSVPGQTSFGTLSGTHPIGGPVVAVPGIGGALTAGEGAAVGEGTAAGEAATSRPRPGALLGGAGGWVGSSLLGAGAKAVELGGFLAAALWLLDPNRWLRIFEVVVGFTLMLLGLRGLIIILAGQGNPVEFRTFGGAARSLHERTFRPAADTFIPGHAQRRKRRRERRRKASHAAQLSRDFGDKVPF